MKTKCVATLILLISVSCGGDPEPVFTPEEMEFITVSAGMLARNLAYLPDSSGWSAAPDSEMTLVLESLAEQHVELWPVFFRAAADTASKLEQLMVQRQQEAQQLDLL